MKLIFYKIINRVLRFHEEYKVKHLISLFKKAGEDIVIKGGCSIGRPHLISAGSRVRIGSGCIFKAAGGIEIGSDVLFGPGCIIATTFHKGSTFHANSDSEPVIIGNNVWMGAGVIINPGVTVGSNVIIASGSVVIKNVPDNVLVAGVPAIIKNKI